MFRRLQPSIARITRRLDQPLALASLSAAAGMSPFHFQRVFTAAVGESPKQFTRRLRLNRAAALLLSSHDSILDIALACGFESHEGFTRSFTRQFGIAPLAYRRRGLAGVPSPADVRVHADLVATLGPCIGLVHAAGRPSTSPRSVMPYSINRQQRDAQPVLVVRRRVTRSEIAATIAGSLPAIFMYAQQHGRALASHPFTRYVEMGPGMVTIEPGMQVLNGAVASTASRDAGQSEVVEDVLPGGSVAVTIHQGPYDTLIDAYAALETWMSAEGLTSAGAPWEHYVTDPAEHPDPKDWRTEVCWPIR